MIITFVYSSNNLHVDFSIECLSKHFLFFWPRLMPETVEDLEHFVRDFFKNVPLSTVICVSLLDSKYVSLLGDLPFNNSSPAWMFLTRFGSKGQPVVLLLPILSNFEGLYFLS